MSLQNALENPNVCRMEEKFTLVRKSDTEYVGKYPLQPFREDARGTYGGEFVAQSLRAAWELIEDPEFDIHSLHSYFLKAGLEESVMRYEVTPMSQGRNYCSRLIKCFQTHNDQLCFTMIASFTRNNNINDRKAKFSALPQETRENPRTKVPFEFLRSPHWTFDKYVKKLDELPQISHTNDTLTHIILPETWRAKKSEPEPASREFGLFFRVHDNVELAKNKKVTKMVDFAFALDSLYLSTAMRAVMPKLDYREGNFFRVSLDHTIYFHDTDFDPTEWMFLDYKFQRLSNDRILVTSSYFTRDKRLVATVQQEALALFPLKLIEKNRHGSYKL